MLRYIPGLSACFFLALISLGLNHLWAPAGAAVIAMFLGMVFRYFRKVPESWGPGMAFTSRKLLKTAIIFLGGSINLAGLLAAGRPSLFIMIFTLTAGFLSAWVFGKYLLGIHFTQRNLIAVGTGICGGSAIAALSPVLEADEQDIAFAISATFLFDVLAVLVFPLAGRFLGLSDSGYGLWAGTSVNDTSSVVAAGYAFSEKAGDFAAVVKMARTTMLLPLGLVLNGVMFIRKRKQGRESTGQIRISRLIPWFVLIFAAVALLNTFMGFPPEMSHLLKRISAFIIAMALGAIGLNTDLRTLLKSGSRPLLLGGIVSLVVVFVSLAVQFREGLV